jgi:DNA-binding transcriptional LysR family regulator
MQLGSIEAIKRMVRAGLGYSIVPRMAVEQGGSRRITRTLAGAAAIPTAGGSHASGQNCDKRYREMLRLLHAVRL